MAFRLLPRAAGTATAVLLAAAAIVLPTGPAAAGTTLVGTFTIDAGSCAGGDASGSYIRMILPSGSPSGPFMSNSDSTCRDQSFTLLRPGTDGGLVSGSYQSPPSPAFDAKGNALANRVTAPATFYGTAFATGTSPTDPQTGTGVPVPRLWVSGGALHADLRAFAVTWNSQNFNQGAPKPDGSYPGNTRSATGTYDSSSGAYTLQWTSQVVGGPFDKFTGLWHLTGRFVARASSSSTSGSGGSRGTTGTSDNHATAGGRVSTGGGQAAGGGLAVQPGNGSGSSGAAKPGSAPATTATGQGDANASPVAATTTISREHWRVSWWLLGLALGIAAVGVLALLAINRRLRAGASS